jgi:putative transposase
MKREYKPRSRGVSNLHAHLVITTKYRYAVLTRPMVTRLTDIMTDLCSQWQCEFVEGNGEPNHYHLLFRYFPQIHLSDFIGNIKSISSRRIRAEFPEIVDSRYWEEVLWSEGYSIEAIGEVKLDVLIQYVRSQPTQLLKEVTERYGAKF